MRYRHLLVPLAPNQELDPRFTQIFDVANHFAARVTLFSVIDDITPDKLARHSDKTALALLEDSKLAQHRLLEQWLEPLRENYPQCRFDAAISAGIGFVEIIRHAEQNGVDLIAIEANRGHKKAVTEYGSTARHLMRNSAIPVWTLTRGQQSTIRRIVAAVDVAAPTPEGIALNQAILDTARAFASYQHAEVTLFHAWKLIGEDFLRVREGLNDLDIALYADNERSERLQAIQGLVDEQQWPGKPPAIELVEGKVSEVLPGWLEREGFDLLIMGTLCRTGIAGFVIGNTAESMLDAVNCSVVTLKPHRFVSPVEH